MALSYKDRDDLTRDGDYQRQARMAALAFSGTVQGEAQTITPHHQSYWDKRRVLARRVIEEATQNSTAPTSVIMMIANYTAAVFSNAKDPTLDADILNQISVTWDDLAGVDASDSD